MKFLKIFFLIFFTFQFIAIENLEARSKKHSRSRKKSRRAHFSRHSRYYKRHSNGPDLKSITTISPYTEELSNGIAPVEIE